jgi:hypothetical protein
MLSNRAPWSSGIAASHPPLQIAINIHLLEDI